LLPGGYVLVGLKLQRDVQPLRIPASALIFDRNGLRVATVSRDGHVLFKKIDILRDLGREIEVASGLTPDDRVIVTPMDGIADGDQVHILERPDAKPPATSQNNGEAAKN
jgi:membrane fusion protein (multidrug efflux system)